MNPYPILKDPDADLDYAVDWGTGAEPGPWLPAGDSIATSVWTVPDGLVLGTGDKAPTITGGNLTRCWLSGGTAGTTYQVTNQITTVDGRVDERSLTIQCVNR